MRPRPLFVELCAGTGTLAQGFRDAGWRVLTIDADPAHGCDLTADVLTLPTQVLDEHPHFVHASPPCPEFTLHSMPWTRKRNPPAPSMALVRACLALIRAWRPLIGWSLENVRGAVPFFRADGMGDPALILGSFYLWGSIPPAVRVKYPRVKHKMSGSNHVGRASFPPQVVGALVEAVDAEWWLLGEAVPQPLWVPCGCCGEFQCTRHKMHASECPCPAIEDLGIDPYTVSP